MTWSRTPSGWRELKKSRSHLCSEALRDYVARHSAESSTDALDRIRDEVPQRIPARRRAPHPGALRLVIAQGSAINRSRVVTVVCAAPTQSVVSLPAQADDVAQPPMLQRSARVTGLPGNAALDATAERAHRADSQRRPMRSSPDAGRKRHIARGDARY